MGQAQVCEDVVQGFPFVGAGVEFDAFPEGEQVVALGCRDGVEAVEFFVDGERCGAVLLVGQHAVYASGMVAVNPADECKQVAFSGAEEVVYLVHVAVVLVLFLPFGTETAGSEKHGKRLGNPVSQRFVGGDFDTFLSVLEQPSAVVVCKVSVISVEVLAAMEAD